MSVERPISCWIVLYVSIIKSCSVMCQSMYVGHMTLELGIIHQSPIKICAWTLFYRKFRCSYCIFCKLTERLQDGECYQRTLNYLVTWFLCFSIFINWILSCQQIYLLESTREFDWIFWLSLHYLLFLIVYHQLTVYDTTSVQLYLNNNFFMIISHFCFPHISVIYQWRSLLPIWMLQSLVLKNSSYRFLTALTCLCSQMLLIISATR